jgi:hypothetical protein
LTALIKILDSAGNLVGESWDLKGIVTIENVKPWWPFLMHEEPGYLYTMEVRIMVYKTIIIISKILFAYLVNSSNLSKRKNTNIHFEKKTHIKISN